MSVWEKSRTGFSFFPAWTFEAFCCCRLFGTDVQGRDCGDAASDWLGRFLNAEKRFRLVHFEPQLKARRPADSEPLFPKDEVLLNRLQCHFCDVCRQSHACRVWNLHSGGGVPGLRACDAAVWGLYSGSEQQGGEGVEARAIPPKHRDQRLQGLRWGLLPTGREFLHFFNDPW